MMRPTPASHSAMFNGPTRSALPCSIVVESLTDRRLDEGGVGLTTGGLHDLPDQEPDGLRLARPVVRDGRGVGGEDVLDGGGHRSAVRDLAEAAVRDDRRRRLARPSMRLEHLAA